VLSKLCSLDQWVSPLELRAAIAEAQAVLGSGTRPVETQRPAENREHNETVMKDTTKPSLTEGLKRLVAARESGLSPVLKPAIQTTPVQAAPVLAPLTPEPTNKALAFAEQSQAPAVLASDSPVERVLRVFQGTLVNQ
jgi:hypothetical protein